MTPSELLGTLLVITALAATVEFFLRRRHVSRLREIAHQRQMHFSASDRFRLAARVVPLIPAPGAASVRVSDLLYGVHEDCHRYVFCTEYTVGVLRTKTAIRRVARFSEPRDASVNVKIDFASEHLPLIEQYKEMLGI